jgi:hypothetical protein
MIMKSLWSMVKVSSADGDGDDRKNQIAKT